MRTRLRVTMFAALGALALVWPSGWPAAGGEVVVRAAAPSGAADLWLAPSSEESAMRAPLAQAVGFLAARRAADSVAVFEAAVRDQKLGGYALLFLGRAQLALDRHLAALATSKRLLASAPSGFLEESALRLSLATAEATGDRAVLVAALERLVARSGIADHTALRLKLGQARLEAGDSGGALALFEGIYYEDPASREAAEATRVLTRLKALPAVSAETGARMFGRAERQFASGQYSAARTTFAALKPLGGVVDQDRVSLRLAEIDFNLKQHAAALGALDTYLGGTPARRDEAEFYRLSALRDLGRRSAYLEAVRAFVDRLADPIFSERALNDLGTFHVLASEDETAAGVFRELFDRFPSGAYADRAAWKAGWWAYRTGAYAEAVRIFEAAAAGMRRSSYRPAWLYWAGRARMAQGQTAAALAAYAQAIADYRNSYYGRAAIAGSEAIRAALRPAGAGPVSAARLEWPESIDAGQRPANAPLIQALLAAGMYDEAVGELRLVQSSGGGSPLVDATIAYALNRKGQLRSAITAMRRAYPEYVAAGGEALPAEILTVIYPVDHWDLIQRHAVAKKLDPFLVASLVAQESTFQADIRSAANAYGLMQILPATGRQYARQLRIPSFSTQRLIDPGTNLNIGTTYLAELVGRFGDVAPALAAYNAGPSRVVRWLAERPGLPRDEFIDDIPFPETQNYVKRVLGAADDYRRLYR